jgi:hypothetical protein
MSLWPDLAIEWLPDGAPNDDDGSWEDLTAYLVSGSTKRGRQYELDRFVAGTMSLTLKTSTRLFDPENAAGTYYGKLTPMKQIRVTWDGDPVWRGFVTSWGTTEPDDVMFVTTISAKDAFERLERYRLPSSAWALEITNDDPTAWFRLGESDTPRITDNTENGNYGLYDNCQQGQQGLVVNDSDGAVSFAHSLEERAVIQNRDLLTGYPFTISFMFKIDNTEPAGFKTIFVGQPGVPASTHGFVLVWMPETGSTVQAGGIACWIGDGTNTRVVGTHARYDDNLPHHCAIVCTNATTFQIYIDGAAASQGTGTSGTGAPAFLSVAPSNWVIGNYPDLRAGDYGFGANADGLGVASQEVHRGTLDEFCVWDGTALGSTRIAAHALAAKTGWADEDTGARVTRFLDRIGWSSVLRDIDTGISTLGPANWSAKASALSVMQGWADTELGAFFVGKDGKIVWRSRHYPLLDANATTSQATFGDGHSGETLRYDNNGLELVRDENLIRNPVSASRTNGVTVEVSDDTLIDDVYGDRTWAMPGSEDSKDSVVRDRAMWGLARFKNEATRLRSMTISPDRDPTNLWPAVMDRELGDRITVKRTPVGLGAEIELDFIVESIEHKFDVHSKWTTTFSGSPVDPNVGDYLILDDATYGLLDSFELAY